MNSTELIPILKSSRSDGICLNSLLILTILADEGYHSMGKLAGELQVTGAAVTGHADILEKRNFIRRVRVSHDRRVIYLQITDLGQGALERILSTLCTAA